MKTITCLSIPLLLLIFPLAGASKNNPSRHPTVDSPVVLRVEGKATTTARGAETSVSLKTGDAWEIGSQIHTEINSRMAMRYGDGFHIRLNELTTLALTDQFSEKKDKDTIFNAITGNIWISLLKDATRPVSILTANAWIQSKQGIFRLSIFPNSSVLVKVYKGQVNVKKKKSTARKEQASRESKTWTHVLNPMQQIFIRPDGTSTYPFQFMVKPDRNSWVLWNQDLDKALSTAR